MNKINWFSRLFMKWDSLVEYINKDNSQDLLAERDVRLKEMQKYLDEARTASELLRQEQAQLKAQNEQLIKSQQDKDQSSATNVQRLDELRVKLNEKDQQLQSLRTDVSEKLLTLNKIEKSFFASTGNKGKGELGELQVKTILEKSGLDINFWTENLMVGDKSVEFAIKSGEEGKWIPVDSKVLDPQIDSDGLAIIDSAYKSKVNTQAKEVAKYLGKDLTANYGILVLQSDSIYMKLFEEFPSFFQDTIRDSKIHIMSPSSFVQFAWSIAQILEVYEKVHKDEKIYNEIVDALTSVTKFGNKLVKVHSEFNIAMDTHYPTIQKRQAKLSKTLKNSGKIKELPKLDK